MSERRGWFLGLALCAWVMLGSAACGYMDEDMALSDEEFAESLEGEQIYDMGEMTIGGLGLIGFGGGCGFGHWGQRPIRRIKVRSGGASSIITEEPAAKEPAPAAISQEEEALAWLAYENSQEAEIERPWGGLEATARAGGAHFVEAEANRRGNLARVFGEAGAMR